MIETPPQNPGDGTGIAGHGAFFRAAGRVLMRVNAASEVEDSLSRRANDGG